MNDLQSNAVLFVRMQLFDYCAFKGSNTIEFNRHRTMIIGDGGTGKTTIAQALAHLGPTNEIKANSLPKHSEMVAKVELQGDPQLIRKYGSIIFLDYESIRTLVNNQTFALAQIVERKKWNDVEDETRAIFAKLLFRKPLKIRVYQDLNVGLMSAGEKTSLGYAFVFAVRNVLNIDLPVVFDSPYGILDIELRQVLSAFLNEQSCQQILLGHREEFREEDKPHYTLDHTDGYSRVIKTLTRF